MKEQQPTKVAVLFWGITCYTLVMTLKYYLLTGIVVLLPFFVHASVQDEINQRNQQIEEIQKQIDAYQDQINANSSKALTLSSEIAGLDAQINKIQLEVKSLGLSITQTGSEINITGDQIHTAEEKIDIHKKALAKYLQSLYQVEGQDLIEILFKNNQISDFFNSIKNLQDTQDSVQNAISDIKNLKSDLEDKKAKLEDKKSELEDLKSLQISQKNEVDNVKKTKNKILTETKGEEQRFQKLVVESKKNIEQIRQQVFYLQQNGVSVEDAIKFGQLTALRVGIRPAFLIAILEVETGLGHNVGTGNWKDDMYNCYLRLGKKDRAETEKAALFEITAQLGISPDGVKVSREPNYGCGGALGPAQFLPSTWLSYRDDVTRLTGHNPPNPWNIEDAFMASAVKLSRAGATNKTYQGEISAAKAYISGKASCTSRICNYYSKAVLDKAAIIERNL